MEFLFKAQIKGVWINVHVNRFPPFAKEGNFYGFLFASLGAEAFPKCESTVHEGRDLLNLHLKGRMFS